MKKFVLIAMMVLSGCATTKPNPMPLTTNADRHLSCYALTHEMDTASLAIAQAEQDAAVQRRKNTIYAVTGLFVLVPLFFMDFSGAAAKEEQAAKARFEYLRNLRYENGCKNDIPG